MYKPGYGNYFYLEDAISDPKGSVDMRLLSNDIARGVKRLSEDSYCPLWGATRTSMRFMKALMYNINVSAVRAELRYTQRKHFTLIVKTVEGYELMFKGVSGGYYGEGTRGCYDILKVCGFSEKQCQRVFEKEAFTVSRRV